MAVIAFVVINDFRPSFLIFIKGSGQQKLVYELSLN